MVVEKEPDLGTAAIIAVTGFAMFVPGGVSKRSLAAAVVLAVSGCWLMIKHEPYRLERIENHIQRWSPKNVDDTSYQTVQSELAMATGGVTGIGVGNGRAKQVIPATTTDFIWATLAEEFGLAGSLVVLAVIAAFVWRLLQQSSRAPSRFGSLVLFGLGAWIGIQACVNVMMANGFLPAIGIPGPFLSSGGSGLIALWCAVGLSQSVLSGPILAVVEGKGRQQPRVRRTAVASGSFRGGLLHPTVRGPR
jgi:cell division protein FtsW